MLFRSERSIDHVWSDPEPRGGTLKGRRRLGIALAPKKLERPIPESFRDLSDGDRRFRRSVGIKGEVSDGDRRATKGVSMQDELNNMYLILIKVINNK